MNKIGLKSRTVRLQNHSSSWAREFEREKRILKKVVGILAKDIEHIGSTSIKGLKSKPIIDVALGVKNIREARVVVKKWRMQNTFIG